MAKRILSLALTLALVLSLAACGKTETPAATATAPPTEIPAAATVAPTETLEATTIRLEKLDGSGTLENEAGKALTILDGMQLFSGYTVGTQDESYAYLSLDATKALKLDAVSS
ncbi:MAG: hypothetical protein LBN97_00840, partial [Oscillospiraceae bacterium]|nr:hypothetical protein [Oscillospiraceae bacterium]